MSAHEEHYFNANRELWNKRAAIHKSSGFYDVEGFKKGKSSLNDIELREMGDVMGKSMLHLQCHFGLDSMSWSRLGAKVTGVDFSGRAIDIARGLNDELGLDAHFICSNIYDLQDKLNGQFDIVFTSYGTIGWLPDLDRWAAVVGKFLKPGGVFFIAEFHPVMWMFDDDFSKLKYPYFNSGVIETEEEGTYADKEAPIKQKEYSWNHSLASVMNSLIDHGLRIDSLNEYNFSPYDCFANTVQNEEGNFYIKGYEKVLPMVYSIKASKS